MKNNILYIHQYFKTPEEGGVTRSFEIAKQLVEKGHSVTLITSWNAPEQITKMIEGIAVIYLPVSYSNSFSFLKRILSFIKFKKKAIAFGKTLDRPDVIYATSTPLTVGLVGKQLAAFFSCPWVFEIRDLWPEVPVRLGIINSKIIKNYLYKVERYLLQSADKIVALSPYNQSYINTITPNKCILVSNFSNNELYHLPENKHLRIDKFRIGYFGAISTANGLDAFIELAQFAQKNNLSQYEFVLAGKGKSEKGLKISANNLNNITFLGHLDKPTIAKTILTCQASYISFINNEIMQSCSPNKFFDSLAAGRLIISNTVGWISEEIEKNDCGFYAANPVDFFEKIEIFTTSTDLLNKAQANAKKLAVDSYDKTNLIAKIEQILLDLTSE
jgi:glycosyltransferase involved in cell wall biosynthesis